MNSPKDQKHALKLPAPPPPREFDESVVLIADTEPVTPENLKRIDDWFRLIVGTKRAHHMVIKSMEIYAKRSARVNEAENLRDLIVGAITAGIAIGCEVTTRANKGVIIFPTPPTEPGGSQ